MRCNLCGFMAAEEQTILTNTDFRLNTWVGAVEGMSLKSTKAVETARKMPAVGVYYTQHKRFWRLMSSVFDVALAARVLAARNEFAITSEGTIVVFNTQKWTAGLGDFRKVAIAKTKYLASLTNSVERAVNLAGALRFTMDGEACRRVSPPCKDDSIEKPWDAVPGSQMTFEPIEERAMFVDLLRNNGTEHLRSFTKEWFIASTEQFSRKWTNISNRKRSTTR